jgi:uncharacterized protein YndB with AHSA1/START domain
VTGVAHDRVRVTTFVAVPPRTAFEVFTRDIDGWWRHGPRYRMGTRESSVLRFEGEANGRLVEALADGRERVIGRVLAWEPGARLTFEWRAVQFEAHQTTEVEVTFEPGEGGTRVTLEHRGWASIPPDHVVRHGLQGADFIATMGRFWGDLATTYRLLAAKPAQPAT